MAVSTSTKESQLSAASIIISIGKNAGMVVPDAVYRDFATLYMECVERRKAEK